MELRMDYKDAQQSYINGSCRNHNLHCCHVSPLDMVPPCGLGGLKVARVAIGEAHVDDYEGVPAWSRARRASMNALTRPGNCARVRNTAQIPSSTGSASVRTILFNAPLANCS
jgi:hypothetical protein